MNMMRRDLPAQPNTRTAQQGQQQPATRPGVPQPPQRPGMAQQPARPGAAPQRPAAAPVHRPGTPAALSAQAAAQRVSAGAGAAATGRPSAKGEDLAMVIRQLSELLVKENAALKKHRNDEVKALAERKEQLARLYQGHMNAVHRDPSLVKSLDVAKRTALTQGAVRLGELMQENASLLKANIQSINMFFAAVNDALKTRQEEKAAAYSRRGALNGYAVAKRNLAVSFNQTM